MCVATYLLDVSDGVAVVPRVHVRCSCHIALLHPVEYRGMY